MRWKSHLLDLALASIPFLAIGIPVWMQGVDHHDLIDETTLIAPTMTATAIRAPQNADFLLVRICAENCIVCSTTTIREVQFERPTNACLRPEPALRIPAGESVDCRSECEMIHAVVVNGEVESSS